MMILLTYAGVVAFIAIGMGYDVGRAESSAGPEVVVACAVFWPVVVLCLLGHRIGYSRKQRELRRGAR